MAENRLEQDIIQLYDNNLVNLFSINQISRSLKKKYPYINKKVSELIDSGIMKKTIVGRSYLCSLDLENPKTILLLSLNEMNKKRPEQAEGIIKFVEANRLQLSILCVVEFNNRVLFVVNEVRDRRAIQRSFPDSEVVDKVGLLDILSENKELFTSHNVLYGYENFFSLLKLEISELKKRYSPLRY